MRAALGVISQSPLQTRQCSPRQQQVRTGPARGAGTTTVLDALRVSNAAPPWERFQDTPDLPEPVKSQEELAREGRESIARIRRLAGLPELDPSMAAVQSQANAPIVTLPTPEKKRRMVSPGDYRNPPVFEDIEEEPAPKLVVEDHGGVKTRFDRERAKRTFIGFCAFMLISALVSFAVWAFVPHEHRATVTSLHWQYTRELQQRYTRHGEGWGSPPGAFNVSCERRQHGTEDCHPHDCNAHQVGHDCHGHDCNCHTSCEDEGNGYSSCSEDCDTCYDTCYSTEYDTCYDQCPVYDDWCSYNYYQWVHVDTEITSGGTHEVYWGTRLHADGSETQRILTSQEYTVTFVEAEDRWTFRPNSLANFDRFDRGVVWDVKTNYAGMIWPQHRM